MNRRFDWLRPAENDALRFPPPRSGGGGPHEVWWRGLACSGQRVLALSAPLAPPPPPTRGGVGGAGLLGTAGPGPIGSLRSPPAPQAGEKRYQSAPAVRRAREARPSGGRSLLAVLLDPRRAQPGQAMLVDRVLPGQEFLDRQGIAAARFFERKQSAAHRRHDLSLAANNPALRSRRGKVGDRQRRTVWPDDILDPRAMGLGHINNSHKLDTTRLTITVAA